MPGVLEFTLGLEVADFLSKIGMSAGGVLSFASAGKLAGEVWEKTWKTIEAGAELEKLSRRTGQTVGDLFQLEKGFKAAGLSAAELPTALFMLQKSLGGVNEFGQKTEDIFTRMGLSAAKLKTMDAKGQLDAVLTSMSKMGQSDAAKAGSQIFGRGEGANMLELSRSLEEFQKGMKDAANSAYVFERVAAVFRSIEMSLERVKDKLTPIWLAFAEQIAPAAQRVLDLINSIDVEAIADGMRRAFANIGEAWKEGKLLELITKTFEAGVEYFGNLLFGVVGSGTFWSAVWQEMVGNFEAKVAIMGKMVMGLGTILTAGWDTSFQKLFEWIGKIPKVGKMLGLEGYSGQSFAENYEARRKEGSQSQEWFSQLFKSGVGHLGQSLDLYKKAWNDAQAKSGGPAQDALRELWEGLTGRAGGLPGAAKSDKKQGKGAEDAVGDMGSHYKPEFTSLEKMGFVMGGLGNPLVEHARETAMNTRRTAELLERQSGGHAAATGALIHQPI